MARCDTGCNRIGRGRQRACRFRRKTNDLALALVASMWQANLMIYQKLNSGPSLGVSSIVTALYLVACAPKSEAPPPSVATPAASPSPVATTATAPPKVVLPALIPVSTPPAATQSFETWRDALRQDVLAAGIRPEVFETAFANLVPNPRVVALDRGQPEAKTTSATYVGRRLTAARISQGKREREANRAILDQAELTYGVPANVMVAIWGMETSYGADTGSFDVVRSLASLAYDGRRSSMFRTELIAALTMLNTGKATPQQLRGSWAGAMGHPQFMPSSFLELAIDGDQDGKVDIWSSREDVFASMGNYLRSRGWRAGVPWGVQVTLPSGYDVSRTIEPVAPIGCRKAIAKHSALRPISVWKSEGLFPSSAASLFPDDGVLASIVQPDGIGGPAYLVTENYRVILAYNCSNYYALSVLLLADRIGR
jgi:membrane-bound lytic murein transglycosylase B